MRALGTPLVLLAVTLAACGTMPTDPTTSLTVVATDAAGTTVTWRLTCDPVGGDHPTAEAACAALEARGTTALPPVARDRMCTQVYGGPETATVQGTWRGQTVLSTFSRTNGCEIGRWEALVGLLPRPGS